MRSHLSAMAVGIFVAAAMLCISPLARGEDKPSAPDNSGPIQILTASWIGGSGDDQIAAVQIDEQGRPILALNASEWKGVTATALGSGPTGAVKVDPKSKTKADPNAHGYLIRLSPAGDKVLSAAEFPAATILKLQQDAKGNLYVLANAAGGVKIAGAEGTGRFIATISADLKQVQGAIFHENASDFGLDSNGDIVLLAGAKMTRYSASKEKWSVTWKAYGGNRPGGMTVSPETGIAAVVGYGMTKTGHEPYKDPYGYGFDREGKQVWALWSPDPTKEVDAKFGGNGLMADTTGLAAFEGARKVYFLLKADGGNSVCTRDPLNVDEKLNPEAMKGVFQAGAGYGFKGASSTSVIFRIDPKTGAVEKGTWMCAWLTKARANGLSMHAAGAMGQYQLVVGDSASGCPTKTPWYEAPEGGYKGGGFLAVFDSDFKLTQCGYFPGTSITSVACRNGLIVIGGSAKKENTAKDAAKPDAPEVTYPVPLHNPLQATFGGGEKDGWFAVLKAEK